MKNLSVLLFLLVTGTSAFAQETFPVNGPFNKNHNYYAFTNGTIVVDYQTTIPHGTLLIKDGLIVEAGADVKIPKGTVVCDLKGKSVYPSLIDAYTTYGIAEAEKGNKRPSFAPQYESAKKGAYDWNQAIRPETE